MEDEKRLSLNWEAFQNQQGEEFALIRKMLKILSKYTDIGISEMVSKYKQDEIAKDSIRLAALNVYLAVYVGRAEGILMRTSGERKAKVSEFFVQLRSRAESGGKRITDSYVNNKAEVMASKYRSRESKAQELQSVLMNVMHRVTKLLDTLESAQRIMQHDERNV